MIHSYPFVISYTIFHRGYSESYQALVLTDPLPIMCTTLATRPSAFDMMSLSQCVPDHQPAKRGAKKGRKVSINDEVMRALEVARDDPEAACQGPIHDILESALTAIWDKVLADENGYVMTRDEFAIFNFYQDRFRNNPLAVGARERYWTKSSGTKTNKYGT
ncbi:hypothetical protein F4808DRAFT_406279 [Astrocystis sublimbata]|nr:hypothetical protein F4808DRAFT_406279 [Astrocystis sublimbata]